MVVPEIRKEVTAAKMHVLIVGIFVSEASLCELTPRVGVLDYGGRKRTKLFLCF